MSSWDIQPAGATVMDEVAETRAVEAEEADERLEAEGVDEKSLIRCRCTVSF